MKSILSTLAVATFSLMLTLTTASLTKENFSELAGERMVMVKFFAPWCGHCKSLAPAWDELTKEYESSETLFVTECDCTGACKDLCAEVGVQGYPTLKYGSVNALEDYKGALRFFNCVLILTRCEALPTRILTSAYCPYQLNLVGYKPSDCCAHAIGQG